MKKIKVGERIVNKLTGELYLVVSINGIAIMVINLRDPRNPAPMQAVLPRDFSHWGREKKLTISEVIDGIVKYSHEYA